LDGADRACGEEHKLVEQTLALRRSDTRAQRPSASRRQSRFPALAGSPAGEVHPLPALKNGKLPGGFDKLIP
jgi:hypothetical protein